MAGYTSRYDAALVFAARAHRTQVRKGTDIPYVAHVVHVSVILLRYGFAEDIVIAGLLHDVIEDCGLSRAAIAADFGEPVADLVAAVSKPGHGLSWEEQRDVLVAQVEAGGPAVAALKAADTLHNIRSLVQDIQRDGPVIWQRFKRGPAPTLAYYRAVLEVARRSLADHPLILELAAALRDLGALTDRQIPT